MFPQTEGGRVFLEACGGSLHRQITASRTYAFATGTGPVTHDIAANAYYRGINTGVGNALCAQDTGNAAIGVFYDQE